MLGYLDGDSEIDFVLVGETGVTGSEVDRRYAAGGESGDISPALL